ncbi:MAG: EscU/YscU/HrcU family type III secretion system export apparatus switch protein [Planctomycetes bacterium]|nr:EscU/YscU/HrcU family type III secretion system export apparatus switch protein [Planctomycetota bacterium]
MSTEEDPSGEIPSRKNPTVAIALGAGRKPGGVPRVLASGKGQLAKSIVERAHERGLSIERDADLAQVLVQLDLGEHIPEELFMAVAEILYYAYELNEELKRSKQG